MSLIQLLIENVAPQREKQVKKIIVKLFKGKLYDRNLNKRELKRFIEKFSHNFDMLVDVVEKIDPTPTGKYLVWIVKNGIDMYHIRRIFEKTKPDLIPEKLIGRLKEDAPKFKEYLETFDRHKDKLDQKDINRYDNFTELYGAIQPYIQRVTKDFDELVRSLEEGEDYDKYELSGKYDVYIPHNERASCILGVNTEWCTTWGEHSTDDKFRKRSNHFDTYEGDLYIFVNKNSNEDKFQASFESGELKNPADKQISFDDIDDEQAKYFLMDILQKDKHQFEVQNFVYENGYIFLRGTDLYDFGYSKVIYEDDLFKNFIAPNIMYFSDEYRKKIAENITQYVKGQYEYDVKKFVLQATEENVSDLYQHATFPYSSTGGTTNRFYDIFAPIMKIINSTEMEKIEIEIPVEYGNLEYILTYIFSVDNVKEIMHNEIEGIIYENLRNEYDKVPKDFGRFSNFENKFPIALFGNNIFNIIEKMTKFETLNRE